jgi:hypothetical protein
VAAVTADDLRARITAVVYDAVAWRAVDVPVAEDVADAVIAELESWDFLMALLDKHYPADVFPTLPDDDRRDPGPRIVSLIRYLDEARR